MQKVEMPLETFNKILNVLTQLPYNQISGLIDEVKQTAKIQQPLPPTPPSFGSPPTDSWRKDGEVNDHPN